MADIDISDWPTFDETAADLAVSPYELREALVYDRAWAKPLRWVEANDGERRFDPTTIDMASDLLAKERS